MPRGPAVYEGLFKYFSRLCRLYAKKRENNCLFKAGYRRTLRSPGRGIRAAVKLAHRLGAIVVPCHVCSRKRERRWVCEIQSVLLRVNIVPSGSPGCFKPLPDAWPVRVPRSSVIYAL